MAGTPTQGRELVEPVHDTNSSYSVSGNMPAVSVIIPTYNRAHLVGETIESVLQQTFQDFEVIVADDGSTDGTHQLLRTYGDRIRYLFQQNRGAAAARNRAVEEAKGRYLAFCDDDDLWCPDHLELLYMSLVNQPNIGLVFSNAAYFVASREKVTRLMIRGQKLWRLRYRRLTPAELFLKSVIPTLSVVMLPRPVFDEINGFDERLRLVQDADLTLRVSLKYGLKFVDKVTCFKRIHDESLTQLVRHEYVYLGTLEELDTTDPTFRSKVGIFTFARRLAHEYFKAGRRYLANGNREAAKMAFSRARYWGWWNLRHHWNYLRA